MIFQRFEDDGLAQFSYATGYRSTVAASILLRHGYRRVSNLSGGMTAWEAAGLPTVAD